MKKYWLALLLPLTLAACGSGQDNDNPPVVAGTYSLTSDGCNGAFSPQIDIVQDGSSIVMNPKQKGFLSASGTVDNDGNLELNSVDFECNGDMVQNIAVLTCKVDGKECQMTYERN